MTQKTPVRWLEAPEEAPEALLASMRAYAQSGPSEGELAQIRVGLRLATTSPRTLPLKWLALVSVLGGLGAWFLLARSVHIEAPNVKAPPRAPALESRAREAPARPEPARVEVPAPVPALEVRKVELTRSPKLEAKAGDALAELALLRRARRQLAAAPADALAISDEHARLYPRGVFAEERELIAIEALAQLDKPAAIARAGAFSAAYPRSAHAQRIQKLLSDR